MSEKFLVLTNGQLAQKEASASSSGAGDAGKIPALDGSGKLSATMMPSGVGAQTKSVEATENLAANDLVNIYSSSGEKCRKADAANAYRAHGFVLAPVTSGQQATVYLSGSITGLSGMTPGAVQYLSGTAGVRTETPVSTAAYISQEVGIAESATELAFNPQKPITLV